MEAKNTKENATNPQYSILTQFLKDLSFECPHSSLGVNEKDLKVDISVALASKQIAEDTFEVSLKLSTNAKNAEKTTVFLCELTYCGAFIIKNMPDEQLEVLLGIESPQLLFPFARSILMNAISDAGFKMPLIEPINFAALFMQSKTTTTDAPEHTKKITKQ